MDYVFITIEQLTNALVNSPRNTHYDFTTDQCEEDFQHGAPEDWYGCHITTTDYDESEGVFLIGHYGGVGTKCYDIGMESEGYNIGSSIKEWLDEYFYDYCEIKDETNICVEVTDENREYIFDNCYMDLKDSVNKDIYNQIVKDFPEYMSEWNKQCREYNYMTDEQVGECGENLTRFQVAVFGSSETIEEYLEKIKENTCNNLNEKINELPVAYVNMIESCLETIRDHNLLSLVYGEFADPISEQTIKDDLQEVLDCFCKPITEKACDVKIIME